MTKPQKRTGKPCKPKTREKPTRNRRRRSKSKATALSQYELYPMPFFDREKLSTWNVKPTGDYTRDCATGHGYAIQYLSSCDGTFGWAGTLNQIVADMISQGARGTRFADGSKSTDGIVIGFVSVISSVLTATRSHWPLSNIRTVSLSTDPAAVVPAAE